MKQLLSLVAATAIGLGSTALVGCSSWQHSDPSASANSNNGMAGGNGTYGEDTSKPGAYTEGGTAHIEDHRNDAGNHDARPASDKQQPDNAQQDQNQQNPNDDFSD